MNDMKSRVLADKYYLRNDNGELLEHSEDELCRRVAKAIAASEKDSKKWEDEFCWLLDNWKFVPGGRILYGAGNGRKITVSNCYFIPVTGDSLECIYKCLSECARTLACGGGVGVDLSILRPMGSDLNNSAKISTGVVPISNLFSQTSGLIGQQGRIGAEILTLHCCHPDIYEFISMKNDSDKSFCKYANISVLVSDDFMKAVEKDEDFDLWYPVKSNGGELFIKSFIESFASISGINDPEFDKLCDGYKDLGVTVVYDGHRNIYYDSCNNFLFYSSVDKKVEYRVKKVFKTIKAKDLWNKIVQNAHQSAEPGVIFYDTMKKYSTTEYNGMNVVGTNPCLSGSTLVSLDRCVASIKDMADRREEFVGKKIWSVNPVSHKLELDTIVDVFKTKNDALLVRVHFNNGNKTDCTPDHRFMLRDGSYKEAQYLSGGESLINLCGVDRKVVRVEYLSIVEDVYDISVEKNHNFVLDSGACVHNCAEQVLPSYGACCLGSINLSAIVVDEFTESARIDYNLLKKIVATSVRFLDDVLDYNVGKHPLANQELSANGSRRIGLGITGLADMLCKMRIKYDTSEALKVVETLMEFICVESYAVSNSIGKEKGSFILFDSDKHFSQPFYKDFTIDIRSRFTELRNAAVLSVPPVGSGSLLTETSSGIEPIFAISYKRRSESLSQKEFKIYHPLAAYYMNKFCIKSESDLPDYFVTADNIDSKFRVAMQSTIQRFVCTSISSTVNLPATATKENISDIYFNAWRNRCKGITVYRHGSRGDILVREEKKDHEKVAVEVKKEDISKVVEKPRPVIMNGSTVKVKYRDNHTIYITLNRDGDGKPTEVFINLGKSGSDSKAMSEALGRLISLYLQAGGPLNKAIETLFDIKGSHIHWWNGTSIHSLPDAVSKALMALGNNVEIVDLCPKCGKNSMRYENGCRTCAECGESKCGG